MDTALTDLAALLARRSADIADLEAVAGFDGFVDEMTQVVDERRGLGPDYRPVGTIARFAELMGAAAGRSSLREIVVTSTDAGGCSVNLGDGLTALGVQLDCYATLGQPRHPAFDAFAGTCRSCTSWGRPGLTHALEFADGKYMLCSVSQLEEFTPASVRQRLADGAFAASCRKARLIALTNWTLYPHMTAVWRLLQDLVFRTLTHRPAFLIDLVDPRGRSSPDIQAMLAALPGFQRSGPTIFAGNLNEANAVARILGIAESAETPAAVAAQAEAIRSKLGLAQVSTHCIRFAVTAEEGQGTATVSGPFCAQPKKSTGAGDRFNAGYALGQMLGLPAADRLRLGSAASSFFVRHARSANLTELIAFIQAWAAGTIRD